MLDLEGELEKRLLIAARKVRQNAYAPYSKFQVGAAVLSSANNIYVGCNVENVIYHVLHAEKNAIGNMVANEGSGAKIHAMVISVKGDIPPCGPCRQDIAEFAEPSIPIIWENYETHKVSRSTLGELLPSVFTKEQL